jgi:putative transposase
LIGSDKRMSIKEQCELAGVPRSSYYFRPRRESKAGDEVLMRAIDRVYMEEPTFGTRRMRDALRGQGHEIGRCRVRRLMRCMGIEPIYPKPRLSLPEKEHKLYPYLLRDMEISASNEVWCTDITYLPMGGGHVYLSAVLDWFSRKVLSWRLSNSLDASFCVDALNEALERYGSPEIFNTDQGSQFTGNEFTDVLKKHGIRISMDGKGRALDNRMIERLWRSVKYDNVYIHVYESMSELYQGLACFFGKYNGRRHQGIGMTPEEKYEEGKAKNAA